MLLLSLCKQQCRVDATRKGVSATVPNQKKARKGNEKEEEKEVMRLSWNVRTDCDSSTRDSLPPNERYLHCGGGRLALTHFKRRRTRRRESAKQKVFMNHSQEGWLAILSQRGDHPPRASSPILLSFSFFPASCPRRQIQHPQSMQLSAPDVECLSVRGVARNGEQGRPRRVGPPPPKQSI